MRYKKMPNERFEFNAETLDYGVIEEEITRFYDLGSPNSSNFMELIEGLNSSHYITATKGMIEFTAGVYKEKEGKYHVICYPRSVKKEI